MKARWVFEGLIFFIGRMLCRFEVLDWLELFGDLVIKCCWDCGWDLIIVLLCFIMAIIYMCLMDLVVEKVYSDKITE